ncbi:MAG TPA: hypothetical protein VHV77_02290 [Pirellulales bacterium]|jgi:hypothetical protein|nr:hypothetical protein [Pirellulales bacterium]
MTELLKRAISEVEKLSAEEQDIVAARLLAELRDEEAFDRAIELSADKLEILARQALEEQRAGLTEELDPDRL